MHRTSKRRGDDAQLPVIFNALGDATRLRIFRILLRQPGICVSEIATELGVSVPAASYQLKMLETAGFVRRERQGQKVCYVVRREDPLVKQILRLL